MVLRYHAALTQGSARNRGQAGQRCYRLGYQRGYGLEAGGGGRILDADDPAAAGCMRAGPCLRRAGLRPVRDRARVHGGMHRAGDPRAP